MSLQIFMGHDSREVVAWQVAASSIHRRASVPVSVVPLGLAGCEGYNRPVERRDGKLWCPISGAPMATEFAISRFCVPFVQRVGWALFVDCDIACLADIAELFALADERYAVMVVKHQQAVRDGETKMDGQAQTAYARKNWSSICLWNCAHPAHRRLTLESLNTWPGRNLHAFKWLKDEEIGELPNEWNHLVGVDAPTVGTKISHYTLGGPWIPGWPGAPLDEIWLAENAAALEGVTA